MTAGFPTTGARPVWIASYPRSGNTFLRIILRDAFGLPSYSLYHLEGDTHPDPSAEALEEAPVLPRNWRQMMVADETAPPVVIKTHDTPADQSPAIYIARDGRAAIHSYYHYHKKYAFEQPSLTEVIAGACQFGSWSEHYRAWQPKSRPKTLTILYDEMVARPQSVIEQLGDFLKLTPAKACLPEFHELQRRLPSFFRRGQNSDYVSEWTPAQMTLFNLLHAEAMKELGFTVTPSTDSADGVLSELAGSAARLHRMYLEQLTQLGRSDVIYQERVRQLTAQVRELANEVERKLEPQIRTRWVQLAWSFGDPDLKRAVRPGGAADAGMQVSQAKGSG